MPGRSTAAAAAAACGVAPLRRRGGASSSLFLLGCVCLLLVSIAQAFMPPVTRGPAQQQQGAAGAVTAAPRAAGATKLQAVLSPRQREERELEEQDTQRAFEKIAEKFAEKVVEKAAADPSIVVEEAWLKPRLEKLARKAGRAVAEQELRPLLEGMAGLIGGKVWYVTEKGELEVVPAVLDAEQREMEEMRSLIDNGNHTGALAIYQGRYKRFPKNPPPAQQTGMAFEALCKTKQANQTVVLYNYWYSQRNQGRVVDGAGLSWVVETLLAAGRLDMAIDVFRSHPRFDCLPTAATLDTLLREAMDQELFELASELLEATHLGGFRLDATVANRLVGALLDQQCLDHADRVVKVLLTRKLPIEPRVGTYFKNYVVKNGRMHLAYLHLTDPRLTHAAFRASANGYNMLLWRMCRLFMRLRETALGAPATADPSAPVTGTMASQPLTTKNELRGLTLRIARVVAMMNRYGYRVTPQSGAMLQDVAGATTSFGYFRVLEDKLRDLERQGQAEEPDFGL